MSDRSFFGDPLLYEWLADVLLPYLARGKKATGDPALRVWSAGCAGGEEPYGVAILLNELAESENTRFQTGIIATDAVEESIRPALEGLYSSEKVSCVRYGILKKYFSLVNGAFRLVPAIRRAVSFSVYDLADPANQAPPESVFGGFDLILCRENPVYAGDKREMILGKFFRSMSPGGFLILGNDDAVTAPFRKKLRRVENFRAVFQKPGTGERFQSGSFSAPAPRQARLV